LADETSTGRRFYCWQAPGKPIVVYLSFGVISRIREEGLRGLGALPRRGAEVGGILLGTAQCGDQVVVKIVDYLPVLCGHYFGPSYMLTQAEKQAFQQVLGRWSPSPLRPVRAVGYYRSHTRGGLFLSDEDVWLMSTYFPEPSSVALLVRPQASGSSVGGFFFWEDDRIRSESSYAEFPFDPMALRAATPETAAAAEAAVPVQEPAASASLAQTEEVSQAAEVSSVPVPAEAPPAAAPEPEELPPPGRSDAEPGPFSAPPFLRSLPPRREPGRPSGWKVPWRWAPVLLLLALLGGWLGTTGASHLGVPAAQSSSTDIDAYALRLAVSEHGDNLHLTWDRRAPALRRAQRGILIIADGDETRALELDAAQLRSGSVIYRPLSGSVRFRLELYLTGNRTLSEAWEPPPPAQPPARTVSPPQ